MGNSLNRLGALGLATALTTVEPTQAGEPVHSEATTVHERYVLLLGSDEELAQNRTSLPGTDKESRLDQQVINRGVGQVSIDYDLLIPVENLNNGEVIVVFSPVYPDAEQNPPLTCLVTHPTEDSFDGICAPLAERADTCHYTVIPLLGEGTTKMACPPEAQAVYDLALAAVQGKYRAPTPAPVVAEKPVETLKEPREAHTVHLPMIAPKLAFEGSAWLGMGEESIGNPYALGFSGEGDQTPRPALGVDLEWMPMGTDHGLRVGATADTVFSVAGSGFDRIGGTVGWKQGVASLDAHAGVSGEPADVGATALDGVPYAALEFSYERPLPKLPGDFVVSLEGGMDFLRLPNVDPTDIYAMLSIGWQGDFEINRPERTHAPKPVSVAPTSLPEVVESTVLKFDVSYVARSSGVTLPPANEELTDVQKGEVARLSEEMKKLEQGNKHAAVLTDYKQLLDLNLPLPRNAYFLAYQAARSLGDVEIARQALALAMNVQLTPVEQTNSSLGDASLDVALQDIIQHYGYVHLVLQRGAPRPKTVEDCVTLLGLIPPFSPDGMAVFGLAVESLMEKGEYEGYFPVDAASGFAVVPYATEERIQVFTARR